MCIPSKSEQHNRTGRRDFLWQSAGIIAATLWDSRQEYPRPAESSDSERLQAEKSNLDPDRPRGAIYIPARPYNANQVWRNYESDVTRRGCFHNERRES